MSTAILLIAHGSRRANANADLKEVARRVSERVSGAFVEIAYLELARPTIPEGLENCLAAGAAEIRMLPYFLSAGAHVAEDLQGYRTEFERSHPEVKCVLCPPLGLHPGLIDVLLDRLQEGMPSPGREAPT
jgi:sirohydrochlorin ferrochelatase